MSENHIPQVYIITGSGSGIGRAISQKLDSKNNYLVLASRRKEALLETQKTLKHSDSKILSLDLENSKSINDYVTQISSLLSSLGATCIKSLIHNSGIYEPAPFEESTSQSWTKQFQVNLHGPVELTQLLSPYFAESSSVLNISSTLGLRPIANTSAYSASKAAMNSWTQSLALEWSKRKIRVNAICPGIVETPIQSFYKTTDTSLRDQINSAQPLNRFGQPQDIASMAAFLVSDEASWMTGSLIPIDGGILLNS